MSSSLPPGFGLQHLFFYQELYHELHELDRLEQDSKLRIKEVESLPSSKKEECSFDLQSDLKQQKKIVKNLKKKSLWSKTLEEVDYRFVIEIFLMPK